ncbi:MFS transporter [Streptomyces sp. NRRL B-1677]|uniref:MFS transporter n=1 Tax=Streptomyces klenkii TaxID=1420899 RepID=A0A3B0B2Q0_9ACTN|nr:MULTISPECIES: MFS transporter [Streptomyces]MBF6047036.1 MFS transporter [Streptomyces sp. NRRL B-1677]RKN65916.1 MFS transporter [Streptomyces klenkii]
MKQAPALPRGLAVCLMSLVFVPQLALAAYVPALPAIGRSFGVGPGGTSSSLVGYMAAYAVCMILTGNLADRYGSRRVQLTGLVLFTGASVLCLLAPVYEVFVAGRVLQALGAGAGTVISRLWVQRALPEEQRLPMLTALSTVIAVTPAASPPLAGLVVEHTSWRALFAFMAVLGAVTVGAVAKFLPAGTGTGTAAETSGAPAADPVRPPGGLAGLGRAYRTVLANRDFTVFAGAISLAWCTYFTFTTYSSDLLQLQLGASPTLYGALYTLVITGYVAGSTTAKRLGRTRSLEFVARSAAAVAAGAALLMPATVRLWPHSTLSIVLPMAVCMLGVGALFPTCQAGMMRYEGEYAGAASGLFFFLQMASGACYTALTGIPGSPDASALALAIALPALSLLLLCLFALRSRPRAGQEALTAVSTGPVKSNSS